jgi:hypothetical protein
MDPELKQALWKLAEGRHPEFDWPISANHVTHVSYVGIRGRKKAVHSWVVHPPRIGEHIRWMKFHKKTCDFSFSYYEVVQVQWDVRDRYQHLYRPGEEGEGYLTVFVTPVKKSLGEAFDRAERAEDRARQKRRVEKPGSSA